MAHDDDATYIGHMLDMTRRAVLAIKDRSRANYDQDEILRLALPPLVQVIFRLNNRKVLKRPKVV